MSSHYLCHRHRDMEYRRISLDYTDLWTDYSPGVVGPVVLVGVGVVITWSTADQLSRNPLPADEISVWKTTDMTLPVLVKTGGISVPQNLASSGDVSDDGPSKNCGVDRPSHSENATVR